MSITAIVAALVDAGATPAMILAAVKAAEETGGNALTHRRKNDAERQRRRREKKDGHVTSRDVTVTERDGSFLPPSPTPPTTNLSPVTPYSPPKVAPKIPETPAMPSDLAEQIWKIQPEIGGKRRSSRPDVAKALQAAIKRGGDWRLIQLACRAYYRLPASTKSGGEFSSGAAVILNADRWRDFLPLPEPPAQPATEAERAYRLQHFRDTGEWKPSWGERPQEQAA